MPPNGDPDQEWRDQEWPDQDWPAVSVIVPTRDRPLLLQRAVSTILEQRYPGDIECVVVFDQSTPEPVELAPGVERPGRTIRTIANTATPGLAGARNTGVTAARYDLVAFCDDDDEWLPGKLERQTHLLRQHPETAVVGAGIFVNINDRDIPRLPPTRPLSRQDFLRDRLMEINPCTVLVRRPVMLERIGLVDEDIPGGYGEDYDWLLRASAAAPILSVDAPLVRVNWHAASYFAERWRVIIEALHYLIEKHPDFRGEPTGMARLEGQLAFAHAALGERRAARRWAWRALTHRWREQRAYAALAVSTGLIRANALLRWAHKAGRGI
jgi:glycosyltransferase involved in cell wall biosynthesis